MSDKTIEVEYSTNFTDDAQTGQIWQQDLEKIGVTATLKPLDQATWFQRYNTSAYRNVSMVLGPCAARASCTLRAVQSA